jgi:hypothetical protein
LSRFVSRSPLARAVDHYDMAGHGAKAEEQMKAAEHE